MIYIPDWTEDRITKKHLTEKEEKKNDCDDEVDEIIMERE